MVVVIIGMPGVGKTRLALALSADWSASVPCLVLHTDLLKVTLRHQDVPDLRGPVWQDPARIYRVAPVLRAHADKARRDGYHLIIEGTLALAVAADRVIRLNLPEAIRQQRITAKHPSAAASLASADLTTYREALQAHTPPDALWLDARLPILALVSRIGVPQ